MQYQKYNDTEKTGKRKEKLLKSLARGKGKSQRKGDVLQKKKRGTMAGSYKSHGTNELPPRAVKTQERGKKPQRTLQRSEKRRSGGPEINIFIETRRKEIAIFAVLGGH